MPILGAHMSVAGGYHKAVERGVELGCDCIQIFTGNPNRWSKPATTTPIPAADAQRFQDAVRRAQLAATLSHASYLINLASPDDELWKKSIAAMTLELERAEQLGVPHVVVHPGSYTRSSEAKGIQRIARAINQIHRERKTLSTHILLENTAGQGTNLGWKFEQLAQMLEAIRLHDRVGICIDTCHLFAAGYGLSSAADYEATWRDFDDQIGLEKVVALHVNDSQKPFGSRVDRHAHIGRGEMGDEPFRRLVRDPRWATVPMVLETEKGEDPETGKSWDQLNLETLRGLV